jgi:biopolymer transport protein TolR
VRRAHKVNADINVTPLVDVVLVLLIIFMVVTPMVAQGMPVELPRTTHHRRKADTGRDIIVSVTREGLVYVSANRVALEDVPRLIAEERQRTQKRVYLKGDSQASYAVVRDVMQAVRRARVTDVMLATDEQAK